jgi:hypothetical protein
MTNLRKLGAFIVLAALVFAFILGSASSAEAQARDANWVVAVTYQNIGDAPATLVVNFYEEGSSVPIPYDPLAGGTLAAGAGRSFFIGNVSGVDPGFTGNAVISSDQPLVSTVVQFSNDPGFKMRLLYNGFQASDADSTYFVATVLKNKFSRTSVFSIQNTENEAINATIKFYDADNNGNLASTITHAIEPNSSRFIEMDDAADTGTLPSVFNGSAIIEAVKQAGGGAANVVAAVSEYYTNANIAADFEGLPLSRAAQTINVATGLCENFGLDTFYAVSNASLTTATSITVDYKDKDGNDVASDGPYNIGPGQKQSIRTCDPNDGTDMSGFTGSAVISSTATDIVVIGKAQNSLNAGGPNTQDVFTAFLGEPGGSSERAIPFVRWANDAEYNDANNNGGKQRSFIAVQNLENSTTLVDAQYYDKNGVLVGTHTLTIPALSKGNTNASLAGVLGSPGMTAGSFGYYTDGTFGAGVILVANSANPGAEFIAINRTQNPGAGEDANAVPTQ